MNALLLIAEADQPSRLQEIATSFGVDWIHLGAQIVSFCIVCALLHRFAYRPVLAMLEKRRQRIAEGLSDAEKAKAELDQAQQQRQEILAKANEQADKIIEDARAAATRVLTEETSKARTAALEIQAKAREADVRAHDQMLADLRREVGRLVIQTTAAVAGKVLTPEDQKRLAEESASQVAA